MEVSFLVFLLWASVQHCTGSEWPDHFSLIQDYFFKFNLSKAQCLEVMFLSNITCHLWFSLFPLLPHQPSISSLWSTGLSVLHKTRLLHDPRDVTLTSLDGKALRRWNGWFIIWWSRSRRNFMGFSEFWWTKVHELLPSIDKRIGKYRDLCYESRLPHYVKKTNNYL